jgi:polar amino acid transport system permease protein
MTANDRPLDDIPDKPKDALRHTRFWVRVAGAIYRAPLWFLLFVALFYALVASFPTDPDYEKSWNYIRGDHVSYLADMVACLGAPTCNTRLDPNKLTTNGIALTIYLAVSAYALAIVLGLVIGIIRANPPKPPQTVSKIWRWLVSVMHLLFYNVVTFYVEFMRGVPSLVFILVAAFIIVPILRDTVNTQILPILRAIDPNIPAWNIRALDPGTGVIALAMIYAAYLSEIFRAGIQNIPKGQSEAARSLGMTYFQTMRHVVVPQAIRAVIPPLGNDFIAIIKDTSLLTILGVNEVTQLARKWTGSQFTYLETYFVLTAIYLAMTITGSLFVQWIERRLKLHER